MPTDRNNGLSPFFHRCCELWDNVADLMHARLMINMPRGEFLIIGHDGKYCHAVYCWPEGAAMIKQRVADNDP